MQKNILIITSSGILSRRYEQLLLRNIGGAMPICACQHDTTPNTQNDIVHCNKAQSYIAEAHLCCCQTRARAGLSWYTPAVSKSRTDVVAKAGCQELACVRAKCQGPTEVARPDGFSLRAASEVPLLRSSLITQSSVSAHNKAFYTALERLQQEAYTIATSGAGHSQGMLVVNALYTAPETNGCNTHSTYTGRFQRARQS